MGLSHSDERNDRLTRRDADPEAALRNALPARERTSSARGAPSAQAPTGNAAEDSALQPAPVPIPPPRKASDPSRDAPAPIRAGALDDRIGTRRDTSRNER